VEGRSLNNMPQKWYYYLNGNLNFSASMHIVYLFPDYNAGCLEVETQFCFAKMLEIPLSSKFRKCLLCQTCIIKLIDVIWVSTLRLIINMVPLTPSAPADPVI
jgi:hypothetical protein